MRARVYDPSVAEVVWLADADAELVRDGDTVAPEGLTRLIPHATGHFPRRRSAERDPPGPSCHWEPLRASASVPPRPSRAELPAH
jgi:hypothetical protein